MSSTNYQIQWDTIGQGGEDTSSSATYKVRDTFGSMQGTGSSGSYREDGGFRAGIYDPTVSFTVLSEDSSSQVAASGLAGNVVTVTSTSGYAVGDYIVVIENEGAAQIAAMGKVVTVGVGSLTVDAFNNGGTTPTIDGSNDYVYELSGSSLPLGTLSTSIVATGIVGWEAAADVPTGYSVYVFENQNLTTGTDTIADVTDGTVTAGFSEYGGRSSDTSLTGSTFDTEDAGITTSLQQVSTRSTDELKSRDFFTLKAAMSGAATNGSYSHTLTFVFVGNY